MLIKYIYLYFEAVIRLRRLHFYERGVQEFTTNAAVVKPY